MNFGYCAPRMFRVKLDPSSRFGRWFRPLAASAVVLLGLAFALREALSPAGDLFAAAALLAAAAVGAFALLLPRLR